ncbi:3(2),5-bisphosphate nucleotidase HAL2 [Coniochaeta hoffmannii]|uniref:3'(2'),5'-bisphosphate nucleotidase n=1 Tax=Coniochaeta hoffmannii TaxID=91930 RepID=A0AA38RYL9_9PEZI|nr:3(2),5-bisphosphate nucleotidase HAL2 [Coniochaeta hoffmannii]
MPPAKAVALKPIPKSSRRLKITPRNITLTIFLTSLLALALAIIFSSRASLTITSSRLLHLSAHLLLRRPLSSPTTTATMSSSSTSSYSKELLVAQLAVQRASLLTRRVFLDTAKGTVSKSDASPVTIGDFGAQALIIAALKHNFPADEIVAEEEASKLRDDAALADRIWELVRSTRLDDDKSENEVLGGPVESKEDMIRLIDEGNSKGGRGGRIWAIDPIDGTKGFLRGGQYAVCLALMVDGDVKVGVLGCPNLPVDDAAPLSADAGAGSDEGRGVIFSAVKGEGATSRPLTRGGLAEGKAIAMKPVTELSAASFCESVEAGHSDQGNAAKIAQGLGITKPSVRMDSQAKYGSIARGAGDIYLRLPVSKTYQEKIWDHAAGDLIVREAGGEVTDVNGRRLDFGHGRTLAENKGVIAAPKAVHGQVLKVVQEVLGV